MRTPPLILVVDDQSMNVDILSTRLTLEGYEVLTATSGMEAIAVARDRRPDLILLDVIMPDPDGFEVCRRLKADTALPLTPILMITAKTEPEDMVAGFAAGADDYLTKPVDRTVLVARVATLLRMKARHDEAHEVKRQLEGRITQLEAWGHALEHQLQDHVVDLERTGLLKRFLSPDVVEEAMSLGDEPDWAASQKEVVVLSCALHGLETFVKMTEPTGVFEMLRGHHQAIAPFMNEFDGVLTRFASDELQFIFDASSGRYPAEQAVQMALSIRKPLASQCEAWRSNRYGLDVGLGIAYGEATLGLIELENRLNYTMIGAVRRLASRLGAAAQGANVLISQRIWEQVRRRFHAEPAGQLAVEGHADPISFFQVKGEAENS